MFCGFGNGYFGFCCYIFVFEVFVYVVEVVYLIVFGVVKSSIVDGFVSCIYIYVGDVFEYGICYGWNGVVVNYVVVVVV